MSHVQAFQVPAFIPFPEILSVNQCESTLLKQECEQQHTYTSLLGPSLNSFKKKNLQKPGLKEFSSHNWYKILQDFFLKKPTYLRIQHRQLPFI